MEMASSPTQASGMGRMKLGAATQSKRHVDEHPMFNAADHESGDSTASESAAHSMNPQHEVHHQREQQAAELLTGVLKEDDVMANVELRLADTAAARGGRRLSLKVRVLWRHAGLHRTTLGGAQAAARDLLVGVLPPVKSRCWFGAPRVCRATHALAPLISVCFGVLCCLGRAIARTHGACVVQSHRLARERSTMNVEDMLTKNTWQKWTHFGRFPAKMVLHLLLLATQSAQIIFLTKQMSYVVACACAGRLLRPRHE
jgi:hypothetical protein